MHLDKLEIQGFKSFKNKTSLEFPDKYTSIIGPNGSGKSNIIDAICFVLGRSRGLRVNNVSELICNGGKDSKPCKEAKVTLYLSGPEKKSKISREIDRSGKSVYRIDDKAASRQEIIEILGDNEYNIILQGDVNKVIDMKPKERRKIIDDICGIGEYDAKKEKAISELEKVETKISDVTIVIGEKQGYLAVLGKERDEALKFTDLQTEQKKTSATVLSLELEDYSKKEARIAEKIEKLRASRQEHTERILSIKTETADLNRRVKEINSGIIKLDERKGATNIVEIKGDIIRSQERLENLGKESVGIKAEEAEKKEKKKTLLEEGRRIESEIKKLEKEIEPLAEKVKAESDKLMLHESDKDFDSAKTQIFDLRSKIATATEMIQRDESEIASHEKEKFDLEEKVKEFLIKERELARGMDENMLKNKSGFDEYERLKNELPAVDARMREAAKELEQAQIKYAEKASELKTIERTSNHLGSSVTAVMNLKTIIKGIYGPVSQLGSVSNHEYEKALEVAAGARLQNIVVENEDAAAKCIEYLRKKRIGRATFLPINKINQRITEEAPPESLGFARDYITAPAKFEKIFNYVYGDTVLVKDLDKAKKIGIGSWRMVTLDADLITKEGAMTGGHTEEISIKFSSTEELEKEIAALQKNSIRLDGEKQELDIRKKKIEEKIAKLEESVSAGKSGIEKIRLEKDAFSQRRSEITEKTKDIGEKISNARKKVSEGTALIKKLSGEIEASEKRLEKMERKNPKIDTSAIDSLREKKHGLEMEKNGLLEKRKFLSEQLSETEKGLEEHISRQKEIDEETRKQKEQLADLKNKHTQLEKDNAKLIKEVEDLIGERTKAEESVTKISEESGKLEAEINRIGDDISRQEIEKAKLETKLSDLKSAYTAYEGVELIADKKLEDLRTRLHEIEKELASFGSINMRAIESYETLNKEIEDVSSKLETLKNERQSIFDFMAAVEQRKMETFMKAFDIIKANFEKMYADISAGEGTLILDDPRDISNSGLIIAASPKNKKLMNIDLMSGGEKVLTTSAFLLAIQRYKPSHFYIVDELDAALDKENSVKLAAMLSSTEAQFLMITHNDALIKYAQSVIGISMIDGVSQVVGVKFPETS